MADKPRLETQNTTIIQHKIQIRIQKLKCGNTDTKQNPKHRNINKKSSTYHKKAYEVHKWNEDQKLTKAKLRKKPMSQRSKINCQEPERWSDGIEMVAVNEGVLFFSTVMEDGRQIDPNKEGKEVLRKP